MGISVDTSGVVEEKAASLRTWAELIRERFVPLQIAPHDAADMRGTVKTRKFGYLQASTVRSAPQTFTRTKSLVAKESSPLLALGLVDKGVGFLEQDGRECTVTDGGFALYDTSRPFTWSFDADFRMRVYTWPLASVSLAGTEAQRVTAITVPRAQGIGRLVGPMFLQLMQETPGDISAPGSMRMAGELAELAITAGLEAGHEQPSPDGDILRTVQLFIEERLSDPTLSADQIAANFFMSTRTLHRLFARQGLTVAGWIKWRRLEGCRRALSANAKSDQPIRDVAARYGFLNASFFSREFAQHYGESPRQYRLNRQT
jgi:AraC-like DNA-binding protein